MKTCHWYEPADEPGARLLIPGCAARAVDPDDDCACTHTADEVARLREELEQAEQIQRCASAALDDLTGAVVEHADGRQILARASAIRRARLAELAGHGAAGLEPDIDLADLRRRAEQAEAALARIRALHRVHQCAVDGHLGTCPTAEILDS
ncbi:hypothetical protein GCM10017673_40340 [Streptosporangium violaceochromogenes]|nr:hypothetical protein GCM10017673_40340 [Streptosporangium violaceochromogenes]